MRECTANEWIEKTGRGWDRDTPKSRATRDYMAVILETIRLETLRGKNFEYAIMARERANIMEEELK